MSNVALVVGAGDYIGSAIAKRFAQVERDIGPIEVCVFNVGGNVRFPILETTNRVFTKVWQMACLAGFLTGREAAKYMVPRERGAIFFTGATASMRGMIARGGRDPDELPPDTLMNPASVGEAYWQLYNQSCDAWTFELDLRPFRETW